MLPFSAPPRPGEYLSLRQSNWHMKNHATCTHRALSLSNMEPGIWSLLSNPAAIAQVFKFMGPVPLACKIKCPCLVVYICFPGAPGLAATLKWPLWYSSGVLEGVLRGKKWPRRVRYLPGILGACIGPRAHHPGA